MADCVAKVLFHYWSKILWAVDAFFDSICEGPHRTVMNSPATSVTSLRPYQSPVTACLVSWRKNCRLAIWDFCNNIGTERNFARGSDRSRLKAYRQSAPAGSFAANAFGLHDMQGNVFEWVEDCYHSNYQQAPNDGSAWITSCEQDYRVRRGGSWYVIPRNIRSAIRDRSVPGDRDNDLGFRVARILNH